MKVFVTGATGFVGSHLLPTLAARGHQITCLVRSAGRLSVPANEFIGDVTWPEGLAKAMAGMDTVVHLVGIIREFPARGTTFGRLHVEATRNVVAAAAEAGVARYVHMSSNGARPDGPSAYHRTKWEAEELVRASTLAYTIMRPSIIFGPGDSFVGLLADMIRRSPLVPVVGNGRYLLQPVSAVTVAEGFALALEQEETIGRTFEIGGPDRLTYNRVLDLIGEVLGRGHPAKLHLPVCLMRTAAAGLGRFPWFPITPAQITMLLEGNICDPSAFYQTFGLEPVHFAGAIAYLTSTGT